MKRPLAYITAPWSNSQYENAENAAAYCRQVYDAGYSPICPVLFLPTFLKDDIPQEHKDGLDMPCQALGAAGKIMTERACTTKKAAARMCISHGRRLPSGSPI